MDHREIAERSSADETQSNVSLKQQGAANKESIDPVRAGYLGVFALRHRDQLLFGGACSIAMISLAAYCAATGHWRAAPIEFERRPEHQFSFRIELNSASWVEWSQVPGIGPVLAKRIVEERDRNGPFRRVDDLKRVRGIGDNRLREIGPYIRIASLEAGAIQNDPTSTMPGQSP
jgi:competence protein ComEA